MQSFAEVGSNAKAIWTDGKGKILFAVAAGWFLSIGLRFVYPVLLPSLQSAYSIDLTTAGLLLSVLWVAYALGQLPGGILSDRIGERNILVLSTAISAVTIALVAAADSVLVLFAATAAFGAGTALYGVARFTTLSHVFPDNEGVAIGLTMAAGDLGNALLPPAAGLVAGALAWQYGFGLTVPLFTVVAALLWMSVPKRTSAGSNAIDELSLDAFREVFAALSRSSIVLVTMLQFLGYVAWQGFTGFYPTYLINVKGISPAVATLLFGAFFGLGVVIKPVVGSVYDRFGLKRSYPIVMGVFTVTVGLLPLFEGFWSIVIATVFLSSILGYGTITLSYLTTALPESVQGTGLGTLRTIYMTAGAGSPVIMGTLADRGFFDEAFLLLAIVAAVAIALCTRIPNQ
ncbi:MFS transporter (plasmid) [Natrinema zhouii]|uniref:MFS transporter n=1 Tax=Natrinema zhouii TaxID=1710539 RepID=UPI001CFF61B2|nr:MFS transporter [Natrinema zhouii]UHQ98891.1 MFS transporter [Natrinema zhouii]